MRSALGKNSKDLPKTLPWDGSPIPTYTGTYAVFLGLRASATLRGGTRSTAQPDHGQDTSRPAIPQQPRRKCLEHRASSPAASTELPQHTTSAIRTASTQLPAQHLATFQRPTSRSDAWLRWFGRHGDGRWHARIACATDGITVPASTSIRSSATQSAANQHQHRQRLPGPRP